MTFDQETHPRLRFQHNPLKIVVAQVRFDAVHQLDTPDVHAAIQAELAERFPRSLPQLQEITFTLTPQGPSTQQVEQTAVRFGDEAARVTIAIGPEMASFETIYYEGWEAFRDDVRMVLDLVGRHGSVGTVTRFGLRYVDEIRVGGVNTITDWEELLEESLLGTADGLARDPRLLRSLQRVTIGVGEDVINVGHGFTQQVDDDGQLASIYLIDTDLSTSVRQPWDVERIMERADRYHDWGTNVFVRSLRQAGIERLGGGPR